MSPLVTASVLVGGVVFIALLAIAAWLMNRKKPPTPIILPPPRKLERIEDIRARNPPRTLK